MPEPPAGPSSPQSALGSRLVADLEALLNDVEQARELAADFQGQVAEKDGELDRLKEVLARTQENLARMDSNVQQLRKERHALANQVMRVSALEMKLEKAEDESERLLKRVRLLSGEHGHPVLVLRQMAAETERELERLKGEILLLQQPGGVDCVVQKEIAELRVKVATLEAQLRERQGGAKSRELGVPDERSDAINLSSRKG